MMIKTRLPLLLLLLPPTLNHTVAQTYTYDFSLGDQQFEGGVSDFSVIQSQQHQYTFSNQTLPFPLDTLRRAQYMSGVNPSDDLFMYMKRRITGLQPNATYQVTFAVEFASIYPTNAIGVGGAPGEGVTMKAGLTLIEPDTIIIDQAEPYVAMNIDKGNQSIPGVDMDTIGHVGVADTTSVYAIKTNNNFSHPFTFKTDGSGEAWFIIGTDSGFEATTSLYFTSVNADFIISTGLNDGLRPDDFKVYPCPSSGIIHVSSADHNIDEIQIYDIMGKYIVTVKPLDKMTELVLPVSAYLLKIISGDSMVVKKVIVQ
ncbi:MAG: T9SS type A sorting domain-containing protein [Saprospiraceae bacterium]|uniref:T9SS type A sorting domain-containing protein n=1 Tax=Candidatus Opimibacter skivensis TaxID=2982028 RepID=A0A9D7SW82_9BACT|nr:T9SS type A sorting domain-containing protein [Candidatus Opimibacter skivensis]